MENQYRHITTEDGSPSLSLPPTWEPMHSLEGAFSETLYIYQPTVEAALKNAIKPVFLSVGLGLGYNEILIACETLQHKRKELKIYSYESENFLIYNFMNWIKGQPSESDLLEVYDRILQRFSECYKLPTSAIKMTLLEWLETNQLKLNNSLSEETTLVPANAILFDAFSSKTTASLWTQDFLNYFFTQSTGDPCYLSTYACTGELKRTLEKYGFEVEKRKGFGKKRQSTFASKSS